MTDTVYGWITLTEAETYMSTRLGASKYWYSGVSKAAALQTAYNRLLACGLFSFPDDATDDMKNAQCEMALYLLIHQEDEDVRKGLQSQGVTQSGVAQETYDPSKVDDVSIPPIVQSMLKDYVSSDSSPIQAIDLDRDEDENVL